MSHHFTGRKLGDWHRRHPLAHRIASDLLADPAILGLKSRRLVPDIRQKYDVSDCTAATAVSIARKAVA